MKEIILYEIANLEENYTLGYAKSKEVAQKIARRRGFYGGDASVIPTIFRVFDSEEDYIKWRNNQTYEKVIF